ncbi:MAG: hypothetical protein AAGF92_05725 [Myxococcota bacterium]
MQSNALIQSDISTLRSEEVDVPREEILRTVLAITLDPTTAARCAGWPADAPVTRWPSTLYRLVARAAIGSPRVWRRCARAVDRALATMVAQYEHHADADLANAFVEGREFLSGDELAALLWCLIRKRSSVGDLSAERRGPELQIVAARRLNQPN